MKKLFRKIHLWLSVPFGVCITLICFSGAMMVFEKEITELCRHDLYFVKEVNSAPLPLDSIMKTVSAALPDSVSVTGVTISPDPERAWQVSLSKPRRASMYVDQYTGEIKGRYERLPFYNTMFHLHRWMMGDSKGAGKMVVGISTLVLVFILLTGLLMWLTNRKKPLKKSLAISFTKGWPRFWHDLHVAGGIYVTIFLLALALTGLTWSFSWYRNGLYKVFGVETSAPVAVQKGGESQAGRSHGEGKPERTPGVEEAKPEMANKGEGVARHDRGQQHGHGGASKSPYAHWQDVYDHLVQSCPDYRQITISNGSASIVPKGRTSMRAGDRYDFNPRNGEITSLKPYKEQDRAAKVRSALYTVHVGSWGGLVTRILTFLAALIGATLPLTGYYLWIKRLLRKGQPHLSHKE
ncbi:MAG: PepSY domain-containing protein [Bacteroides sp.]|nr:PepSY domain-containing protein [Bacteroides sp.]